MPETVDLYDNAYAHYGDEIYRQIRVETYGEDLGQTGWATTQESQEIPRALQLDANSHALEIGCGSGRYALQVAATTGCRIVGLDVNAPGIANASQLAASLQLSQRAQFRIADASQALPFADGEFDAAFSNDVLCHIPDREALLGELFRVLKPGARFLFSDALVIGGMVTHQELATRSSIGYYVFSPPGENERLLEQAGFRNAVTKDTSEVAGQIAKRWHDARGKRAEALRAIEGPANFEGLQKFLSTVNELTSEKRLLRLLYVAQKPLGKA
ncbi:MAG TPA: methyltransferase domain-containing protein [Candidatus Sulfotelmatobacter sp.]|nr:methyltransferase domain-containing protein [Candidatus Sulfotelmatobacter sp.]